MKNKKIKFLIRPPRMSDLDSCLKMINSLVEERAMLTIQKKLTRREEKSYFEKILNSKNSIHLFLIIDGEVMGNARMDMGSKTKSHIGELGISLKKEARGLGLGEKLFKEIIKAGVKKFKPRIITLDVHAKNKIARNLYEKTGFKKIGTIKGGTQYYGKYDDIVMMVKYLD